MRNKIFIVCCLCFFIPFLAAEATDTRDPYLRVFKKNGEMKREFIVPEDASVVVKNLGKDSRPEIIVGAGPGQEPYVYIYKYDGTLKRKFLAYDASMNTGVNVEVCDLNKDKSKEIITGPMFGGAPQVRIFDKKGNAQFTPGFMAFDEDFRGGVNLACGNVNTTKKAEIVVGAGPGAGAHVRAFNYKGDYIGLDFYPFSDDNKGGVHVDLAKLDDDPEKEIVTSIQSFGAPLVKIYNPDAEATIFSEFSAYEDNYLGGVQVRALNTDKDKYDEIVTMPTRNGGPYLKIFDADGTQKKNEWFAYEEDFRGGTNFDVYKGKKKIYTIPQTKAIEGRDDLFKYIDVNLSEQKLRAYENGEKDYDFYVSTGKPGYDTEVGDFTIYGKYRTLDMDGFYGEDDPENYDLKDVPHVLAYWGDYTIHGAYWHNNFGYVMSHGCINEPLTEAGWLYDWASVGDNVIVHY